VIDAGSAKARLFPAPAAVPPATERYARLSRSLDPLESRTHCRLSGCGRRIAVNGGSGVHGALGDLECETRDDG
jgi:hypothetical protein